ncbi:MAG TPA: hypothetical protein PLO84_05560 [Thermotogota bacterium]|nr:hypothetical protein [Thermotogota bacterium]
MQLLHRRVFVLETNKYYTRGLLLHLKGKKARVLKTFSRTYLDHQYFGEKQMSAVKQAVETLKPDIEDHVVYNYPYQEIIFSTVEMPRLQDEQLRNAVKFKISEDYHIAPSKLIIDVTKSANYLVTASGANRIPVFATKKEFLDNELNQFMTIGKAPEPDVVMPDQLKYIELLEEDFFKREIVGEPKLTFMICQDIEYSVLFTFFGPKIIDITEVPIALGEVIDDCETAGISPLKVLNALMEGSEVGSLEYTESLGEIFGNYYERYGFEAEKVIRSTINKLEIENALTRVEAIVVGSINSRLTVDLAYHLEQEGIMRGVKVVRMPVRQDIPTGFEKIRTAFGFAYRGVRDLGKYKFVQEQKRKV